MSAAAEATAHASSTYDASKDNAKDRLTYIHDYVLRELNDSKDFIYSSWNDNELRSFLEKKGIIRTKSQIKRDELLKGMRQYYAALADPVYDAWSDNYIVGDKQRMTSLAYTLDRDIGWRVMELLKRSLLRHAMTYST